MLLCIFLCHSRVAALLLNAILLDHLNAVLRFNRPFAWIEGICSTKSFLGMPPAPWRPYEIWKHCQSTSRVQTTDFSECVLLTCGGVQSKLRAEACLSTPAEGAADCRDLCELHGVQQRLRNLELYLQSPRLENVLPVSSPITDSGDGTQGPGRPHAGLLETLLCGQLSRSGVLAGDPGRLQRLPPDPQP